MNTIRKHFWAHTNYTNCCSSNKLVIVGASDRCVQGEMIIYLSYRTAGSSLLGIEHVYLKSKKNSMV
jgi:hypothetical protein